VVKVKLRSNSIILDFDWSCMSALGLLINLFSISLGRRGRFPLCVGYAVHLGGRVLIRFELVSSPAGAWMHCTSLLCPTYVVYLGEFSLYCRPTLFWPTNKGPIIFLFAIVGLVYFVPVNSLGQTF